jgi:hypothetical protein
MENKHLSAPQEAILSGYIRYRPSNGTYYLMANSRMLCNQLNSKERNKVKVTRDQNFFIIHKIQEGNILTIRKKEIVTCISGINLLKEQERTTLLNPESKYSFPVKVKLFPSEFNLDKYSLYPDQDTATIPGRHNHLNFKHAGLGGIVRAHFLETYHNCVNSSLSGKKDTIGFIIINEKWKEYAHITKLVPEFNKVNCYIIFSDFKNKWEDISTAQIINKIQL